MKIKRFTAANMQAGLKLIAETLGPEAVILSNKRLAKGLEIVAGVDEQDYEQFELTKPAETDSDIIKANPKKRSELDTETMQQLFTAMAPKSQSAFANVTQPNRTTAGSLKPQATETDQSFSQREEPVGETFASRETGTPREPAGSQQTISSQEIGSPQERVIRNDIAAPQHYGVEKAESSATEISALRQEIDILKALLKEQKDQLFAADTEFSPQYERLESRLLAIGFSSAFTRKVLAQYDRDQSLEHNWRHTINRITGVIVTPIYEPLSYESLSQGNMLALLGPTGAGKTTTVAKLAALAVKNFGQNAVAVVSADYFQVGGQETLRSVCKILEVDYLPLSDAKELPQLMSKLAQKKLVLIDTSGSDTAMREWKQMMQRYNSLHSVQQVVVLPATMHPSSIQHFLSKHQQIKATAAVLSKLDEAASFGGVLEPIMRLRWPLWYCTTGQQIPQDIETADTRKLTKKLMHALRLSSHGLALTG